MPFVFGIFGVLLLVSGVRGKSSDLFALLKSDFTGKPNYFQWMIAIFVVGSIGYIKQLSTISRMFMFLVMAGLLYQNKQVLSEFGTQENAAPLTTTNTSTTATTNTSTTPQLTPLQSLGNSSFVQSILGAYLPKSN